MKLCKKNLLFIALLTCITSFLNGQIIILENNDSSDYIKGDPDFNLLVAADKGEIDQVKKYIKEGADVNTTTYDGVTPLMYAAQKGHVEIAKILLDNKADIEKEPSDGLTALLGATLFNQLDMVEFLLQRGADINKGDKKGVTPLMYATAYNYFILCDMLLYYGADKEKEDKEGNTALTVAVYAGNTEIALLLLQQGANLNHTDKNGNTPLLIATQQNFDDIVSLLLDYNPEVDLKNENGVSPLAQAVANNNVKITQLLLRKDANAKQKITYAETPLTIAKKNKNDSIKHLLIDYGAKKNAYPSIGDWKIGVETAFNTDDFYTGMDLSLGERKYKFNVLGSWLIRPFRTRVLVEEESNTYYQFWERRNIFTLGLEKPFYIYSPEYNRDIYLSVSVSGGYTRANYRGYIQKPDPQILFIPSIGIINQRSYSTIQFHYTYLNTGLADFSPHIISLKACLRFDLEKSIFKHKRINWIEN